MRRRDFFTLFGAAVASPLAVHAQQEEPSRRLGVLMGYAESDPEANALLREFTQSLSELGWTVGRNVRMDVRWAPGDVGLMRTFAKELVDLQPDVIVANSSPVTAALKHATQTIPIVFAVVSDPAGQGFVASLSRPGGNITGFAHTEPSLVSKWLGLLTEIAPGLKTAAMMFNPDTAPYIRSIYLPSFETSARSFGVEPVVTPVRSEAEIETVVANLGREQGSCVLAMPDNFIEIHHALIISLVARSKIPAVYQTSVEAKDGGLLSYGASFRDIFHRTAGYVDRILRGAKAAELPVQMPTKLVFVINLKTARALGLAVPVNILALADEVIE